jgi:hypothetical protein
VTTTADFARSVDSDDVDDDIDRAGGSGFAVETAILCPENHGGDV